MNFRRFLPAVLTVVIIAAAALLPTRIARLGDRTLTGQVHTEPFEAEKVAVSEENPSLRDRLALFARWKNGDSDVTAFYQTLPEETDRVDIASRTRDSLSELIRVLPELDGRFATSFNDLEAYRILLRDPDTGLTARILQARLITETMFSDAKGGPSHYLRSAGAEICLDEDTDQILSLESSRTAYSESGVASTLSLQGYTDLMLRFLDYLDLEDTLVEPPDSVSSIGCFFTLDCGAIYRLDLEDSACVMEPSSPSTIPGTGEMSAAATDPK